MPLLVDNHLFCTYIGGYSWDSHWIYQRKRIEESSHLSTWSRCRTRLIHTSVRVTHQRVAKCYRCFRLESGSNDWLSFAQGRVQGVHNSGDPLFRLAYAFSVGPPVPVLRWVSVTQVDGQPVWWDERCDERLWHCRLSDPSEWPSQRFPSADDLFFVAWQQW